MKSRRKLHAEQAAVLAEAQRAAFERSIHEKLNPEQLKAFKEATEVMRELVECIHSSPPTTKDYYGEYLKYTREPMMCLTLICAGANKDGVIAAARINGIKFA